ncbi:MAG: VOC family protein [Stappiaceae bacterium]
MAQITGVGGVFFKSGRREELNAWYQDVLKLPRALDHPSFRLEDRHPDAGTVIGVFKQESDYFGSPDQLFMINFRVDDLEVFLLDLEKKGVVPEAPTEVHPEGKFTWIKDPDGNRIELWEPS